MSNHETVIQVEGPPSLATLQDYSNNTQHRINMVNYHIYSFRSKGKLHPKQFNTFSYSQV